MESIRFGVFLPQFRMSFSEILEKVTLAEALGFDSAWFIDHMAAPGLPNEDYLEGWTLATAVAARTERIRLGHLVLCNELRHPAVLAKMAATLDHISNGRLELGLGWGSVADELETYGIGRAPARVRAERLGETLEILEGLFAGEPFDYEGRHFRLEGAVTRPRPLQDPLPIHVGGAGPRLTLPLVRRFASWWSCPSYAVDRLAELRPQVGDVRISAQHPIGLVRSAAEREQVQAQIERRFGAWGGLRVGDADELAAALAREVELGVGMFVLQFHDYARPETLEAFANDVIPAVRAAARQGADQR